jgi:hypothetical protein
MHALRVCVGSYVATLLRPQYSVRSAARFYSTTTVVVLVRKAACNYRYLKQQTAALIVVCVYYRGMYIQIYLHVKLSTHHIYCK